MIEKRNRGDGVKQQTIYQRNKDGMLISITGEAEHIRQYIEDRDAVAQELNDIATEIGKWRKAMWFIGIGWWLGG